MAWGGRYEKPSKSLGGILADRRIFRQYNRSIFHIPIDDATRVEKFWSKRLPRVDVRIILNKRISPVLLILITLIIALVEVKVKPESPAIRPA